MEWKELRQRVPELASAGERRFADSGVVLLGSLRRDGYPRISPVEPYFVEGRLELGMMWRSTKALDLLRDPRCTVHNSQIDRKNEEGDFKLWGRARAVEDLDERERFCQVVFERIGWRPREPKFHVFAIDVESLALIESDGDALAVRTWKESEPDEVAVRRLVA